MSEINAEPNPFRREQPPLMVVISGPSGVGKDATIKKMKELGYPFHFVVTATTRPKREDEVDGVDYFFVSMGEFAQLIEQGELLEYAVVYGQYKGIPKQQVRDALASGKDVIMRIDVQGASTIRRLAQDAIFIFISAESEEALIRRLMERKSETPDGLKIRSATAREEMKRMEGFDYCVINRDCDLEETAHTIAAIITAEKARVHPRRARL
ncbi:MAG: guanylate kinase [Chloroflexi bacterium]|nr:guanylate kinase [Chloroflexota bacterium]MBI3733617.1 guanylate kinase [Chloroflexota bacterium]